MCPDCSDDNVRECGSCDAAFCEECCGEWKRVGASMDDRAVQDHIARISKLQEKAHAFARNHVPRALYHHLLGVKPPMARLVGPWTETPRAHEVPRPPKEHDSTHDRRSKAGTGGSWGALKHVLGRKRKPHGSSARTSYSEV